MLFDATYEESEREQDEASGIKYDVSPDQQMIDFDDVTSNQTMRSFSLLLSVCLLINNGLTLACLCLRPDLSQSSLPFCTVQSFFLHVFTLFRIHLTIAFRLFYHYCCTFDQSCQRRTYARMLSILLFVFICVCLFTLPSVSRDWASITFDRILGICLVNYSFNYSYTFFILTLACLIPFALLIISHRTLRDPLITSEHSSALILPCTFFNILLLILLHIPLQSILVRTTVYYTQMISLLIEPFLYLFVLRLLSMNTLFKPIKELDFI